MKSKLYDVYFKPTQDAVITIKVEQGQDVEEIAEEVINSMTREDLIDRLMNAIHFMGIEIVEIEEIE